MKKRISLILAILSIFIMVTGCSVGGPEKTVSEFLDAMKELDFELMQSKINPEFREDMDEIESIYEGEETLEKYFLEKIQDDIEKITYTIEESEVDEDKGIVSVDVKYVDAGPLFKQTFAKYMEELFKILLDDPYTEITEEQYTEIFIEAMDEKSESIEETFTEESLDIECIKIDGEWYINEVDMALVNIMSSNIMSILEEMESFDFDGLDGEYSMEDFDENESILDEGEDDDRDEDENEENLSLTEKSIGEEADLENMKVKITDFEESDKIVPEYGDEVVAKEGTKFIIIDVEVTNTTKSEIKFSNEFILIDDQEREFKIYSADTGLIKNFLDYRSLPPSIKEEGRLVYQVPSDATSYDIITGEGKDGFKIKLK